MVSYNTSRTVYMVVVSTVYSTTRSRPTNTTGGIDSCKTNIYNPYDRDGEKMICIM